MQEAEVGTQRFLSVLLIFPLPWHGSPRLQSLWGCLCSGVSSPQATVPQACPCPVTELLLARVHLQPCPQQWCLPVVSSRISSPLWLLLFLRSVRVPHPLPWAFGRLPFLEHQGLLTSIALWSALEVAVMAQGSSLTAPRRAALQPPAAEPPTASAVPASAVPLTVVTEPVVRACVFCRVCACAFRNQKLPATCYHHRPE